MKSILVLSVLIAISGAGTAYAQTSGGVDVDGTWYLGEGLKEGDYFEYTLCEIDLNGCSPVELKIWIKGDTVNVSEVLWDAQIVIVDGEKTIKGSWGLGKIVPTPILFDDDLADYAVAFKSSIAWLSAYATSNEKDRIHGPQEFKSASWGSLGPVGGGLESYIIPSRVESITLPDRTTDSIVVGWYNDNDNEIWIVDDFPFPVKALAYAGINSDTPPVMFEFELTQYKENIVENPFAEIVETIQQSDLLNCSKEFLDYTSKRVSTTPPTMTIQYNFSPGSPIEGCEVDWKINFYNKYNDMEILDQVNYDIWVVDENDNKLYSYAESQSKEKLYSDFGQVDHRLPVEHSGLVRYAIFVYGLGPEDNVNGELSGYSIIEIQVEENPLLKKINVETSTDTTETTTPTIPAWIKNNAGWWADGEIDDTAFIQGIGFLIKEGTISVESTSNVDSNAKEIPAWIKNNAGWWADGEIDDESFLQGIEFLVKEGIIPV